MKGLGPYTGQGARDRVLEALVSVLFLELRGTLMRRENDERPRGLKFHPSAERTPSSIGTRPRKKASGLRDHRERVLSAILGDALRHAAEYVGRWVAGRGAE
jgi:hypothetical protein